MKQRRIPAAFMRGGTSKALVLKRADLPPGEREWPALFSAMLGSPDPNLRQLDGMGGGISSLSKICVVGPASRADADIDYTFAQVGVTDETADFSGNCGNMSSAIGPFAYDAGLVAGPRDGEAVVRIHNTNSGKIIVARFPVAQGEAEVARQARKSPGLWDGLAGKVAKAAAGAAAASAGSILASSLQGKSSRANPKASAASAAAGTAATEIGKAFGIPGLGRFARNLIGGLMR